MEHHCRFWCCLHYSSNRGARATCHPEDDVEIVDDRTFAERSQVDQQNMRGARATTQLKFLEPLAIILQALSLD